MPNTANLFVSASTLSGLEFDRIVEVVAGLGITPGGRLTLAQLAPSSNSQAVAKDQHATTEGVRFLEHSAGLPLRAPEGLAAGLRALAVPGAVLEPLQLLDLATFLESTALTRQSISHSDDDLPIMARLAGRIAEFDSEAGAVHNAIDPAGDILDRASPSLASIRDRLRRQRLELRQALDRFLRDKQTAKHLQEQVVTDRNGRYVVVIRAEHKGAVSGIVHGASASGASLFVEPMGTVDLNNEIVSLVEAESQEILRILRQLSGNFQDRLDDIDRTLEAATGLDVIQAKARFSIMSGGIEPDIAENDELRLVGARHPLLMAQVLARLSGQPPLEEPGLASPVPVTLRLEPEAPVLIIAGPNTGGKTVALKTVGLFAVMVQAGLHVPVDAGTCLPVFRSLFADIGDDQSITASLSTFSGHIANLVSMDRDLALPALILLDEVGAGTDPTEGGALGTAVIDHFRQRGAHLVATTHFAILKSYASTTPGVGGAAFGFHPKTFAPTYELLYGSPGRSLALEIASRLGMAPDIVSDALNRLTEPEKQLADHLARVDRELARLAAEREVLHQSQEAQGQREATLARREDTVSERETRAQRRLDRQLKDQARKARERIDAVIEELKHRAADMATQSALAPRLNTGATGAARSAARAAVDTAISEARHLLDGQGDHSKKPEIGQAAPFSSRALEPGTSVVVGMLGLQGRIVSLRDGRAEVDVNGKRMRVDVSDLRAIDGDSRAERVRVTVDLAPRSAGLTELNVIGCTVDEATDRTESFLDQAAMTDVRTVRLVHGHGTGRLRRALASLLAAHPMVAAFAAAPPDQGGDGATLVELKD